MFIHNLRYMLTHRLHINHQKCRLAPISMHFLIKNQCLYSTFGICLHIDFNEVHINHQKCRLGRHIDFIKVTRNVDFKPIFMHFPIKINAYPKPKMVLRCLSPFKIEAHIPLERSVRADLSYKTSKNQQVQQFNVQITQEIFFEVKFRFL